MLLLALGGAVRRRRAARPDEGPAETRAALRAALAESRAAEARSAELEREADERPRRRRADRARGGRARRAHPAGRSRRSPPPRRGSRWPTRERAVLREELGREQQPVVHLTAALQQFSRRPVALSVLRPGLGRGRGLLARDARQRGAAGPGAHRRPARAPRAQPRGCARKRSRRPQLLRDEQARLAERRSELAALETRQRLASRAASGTADREAERALALAEEARDLDALVAELDRAGGLRARLAALPGPLLRPARPEDARLAALEDLPSPEPSATAPPAPYLLPVDRPHGARLRRAAGPARAAG